MLVLIICCEWNFKNCEKKGLCCGFLNFKFSEIFLKIILIFEIFLELNKSLNVCFGNWGWELGKFGIELVWF